VIDAAVMSATVNQPRAVARPPLRLVPMSWRLRAISMTTSRNGAAAMPLMIATRTSRLIGLMEVRVNPVPARVPAASSA
jgi:hypothetical protein